MDRRRKRLVALILAVGGLGAVAGIGLSGGLPAQPDVSPLPAAAAAPSAEAPLAEFGWVQFQETNRDQSTLTGFKLRVGTFDGVVAKSIVKSFPALTPASQLRGALPFARGPSAGTILYGFTDAEHSELHWLSASTGEDRLLVNTKEIVHDAAWDARSNTADFVLLRRSDRQPTGIFEVGLSGAAPVSRSVGWAFAPTDHGEVSHQLLLTDKGGTVVVSCASERCEVRATTKATDPIRLIATDVPDRDVYGIAGDALIMGSACTPACPATAIDLVDGHQTPSARYCQSAALIESGNAPVLVSDVAIDATCPTRGYAVRATDLDTGQATQPYEAEDPLLQLVPRPGWELPIG